MTKIELISRVCAILRFATWVFCALAWIPVLFYLLSTNVSLALRFESVFSVLSFGFGLMLGVGLVWFINSQSDTTNIALATSSAIVVIALGGAIYSTIEWIADSDETGSLPLVLLFTGIAVGSVLRRPETGSIARKNCK